MVQLEFVIDLRTRQLEVFLAVADELHFGRAARRLGIAQSAVSQQLRRLEQTLDAVLLERTSRHVALTPAGEALRQDATDVLARVEGLARAVRAHADGEAGTVHVGAQGAALITLVPPAVARLARDLPGLHIDVRQLTSQEQVRGILLGTLDLGLVRDTKPRTGLVLDEVLREPVMAVLPAGHRLARARRIRLADLADEPFVLWGRAGAPRFHDALVAACSSAGFAPHIAYRVRGIDARLSYIAAGLGVGLEAASYAALGRAGTVFRPLHGEPVHATIQLARRARALSPAATRVVEALASRPASTTAATTADRRDGGALTPRT